jgi:hypothetical protein
MRLLLMNHLGKARVKHRKHDGINEVVRENIHVVLLQLSLGLGLRTCIVMVGSLCPQCMGTLSKTIMKISPGTAIPTRSSLFHQILAVLSCCFQFLLRGPLTPFLMVLADAHPYFLWKTKNIQVPLIVLVHMVKLIRCVLFPLHDQILKCTGGTMLSHSKCSLVL